MNLGIIAGSGSLPKIIANQHLKHGGQVAIALIKEAAKESDYSAFNMQPFNIGQVGSALEFFLKNQVSEIIIIGAVKRPNLLTLKVDKCGAKLIARIIKKKILGDDKLLRIVADFIEEQGFKISSPISILTEKSTAPKGIITDKVPSLKNESDIKIGIKEALKLGKSDIGQSVIVKGGLVIAREDESGTDSLIKKSNAHGGVLVKMMKPIQDDRLDVPTIGEETIKNAALAGLAGIAIEAEKVIVVDITNVVNLANKVGIFLIGV
ncbi:MAG: UDP-2,3-diacylglucosamine diphosphatase LpxI [Rickettsiaceae bacterium]|nr:UDP-2,3-diacylglucosamine diphosphatase LpxI [Rickettsiaceae bacterium]